MRGAVKNLRFLTEGWAVKSCEHRYVLANSHCGNHPSVTASPCHLSSALRAAFGGCAMHAPAGAALKGRLGALPRQCVKLQFYAPLVIHRLFFSSVDRYPKMLLCKVYIFPRLLTGCGIFPQPPKFDKDSQRFSTFLLWTKLWIMWITHIM